MKKRVLALVLAAITVVAISTSAVASNASSAADELQIEETTTKYLDAYLREAYLYKDMNFAEFAVPTHLVSRSNAILTVNGKSMTVYEAGKNMMYMENKADYLKATRQAQGIYRSSFGVEYVFNSKETSANSATVNVSAFVSFKYDDHDDMSMLEEVFNIALVKMSGVWLVADVVEPSDWFDATYKNDPTFDFAQYTQDCVKELLAETAVANAEATPESFPAENTDDSISPMVIGTSLSYNRNNAVAYAYTYTTSSGTNTPTDFYNQNFQSFGSDCMNFVSQCVWAGFGGNNNIATIDSHVAPMDVTGAYANNWFSSSLNKQNQHSKSWSGCESFRTYLNNRTAGDSGLNGNMYDIGTGAFSSIPNWSNNLLGAILHVPGNQGDYGHAVIVTEVNGTSRSQVEFCGHTSMAKAIKVGDAWPTGKILVMIPTTFTAEQAVKSPRITATLYKPVRVNTALTLSATTDVSCYSIKTTVITPAGASTVVGTRNNTTTASCSYQFTQTGLYTVKVSAVRNTGDTPVDFYYTIRIY